MPSKRTFKVGADTYDIDEKDVNSFLKDMPDAVEQKSFTVAKDTFDIPIPEVSAFLSDNPNAQPTFGEKKKDGQESVSEEKPKPAPSTDYSSSSTAKPGRLTDFLPEQYRTPEVLAEADHIVKTNSPEKALKKLNDLKTQVDVSNGAPDTRKKKPDQAIADYDITKGRPELDFNATVTSSYNDALNQIMGDPGENSVWLNPKPDVQAKAKEVAFKKALESEAGQRIQAVGEHTKEITEDVQKNINQFSKFLDKVPIPTKVTEYLKSKKTALANDIINPSTNPFFLQQYSIAKKRQIDLEKENNLPELEYETKRFKSADGYDTYYEPTAESIAKRDAYIKLYDEMKLAYDDKYSSLAKMKAATSKIVEGISSNKMPSSQEIGRASLRALGNEDLETAERLEMEGVPLTPKMKYNLDRIGEDALKNTIAIYKPFANRGDEVAKDVVAVASHMIADKDGLLKRNPEFVKEQKIDLISNELASNPNDYYGTPINPIVGQVLKNTGAYVITDAMIEKAAKTLGIDPSGIASSDLKTGNILGAATSGLVGDAVTNMAGYLERKKNRMKGYSEEASDELANRWKDKDAFFRQLYNVPKADELQQGGTMINTDKNSGNYMSEIPNPDAGKYNWGLASVLNTMSYGLGQTYGLGKGGILTGKALQKVGALSKAENAANIADRVGMFTYGYVTGYDRNYETGLEKFKGQENAGTKAAVYASLYSMVENMVEQSILPDTRIVRAIEGPGHQAAFDLVGKIVSNGVTELDKRTLKQAVVNIAKGVARTGKGVGEETIEEIATNVGGNVIEALTGTNKDPNYDFVKEQFDTAIQTALQSFLSIGLAEVRTKSPLRENILHYAANNPTQMITAIKQYQREGKIDPVTAGKRIVAVNTLAQLNSEVPTTDPITNKKLSTEEQVQYLADSYRIALAEKEIKDAASSGAEVGKVKKERLEKIIKRSQDRQKAILESPVPIDTLEMGIADDEKTGEVAKPETVIPARNGDLVALKFSEEEKATYNALTDPDQKQAMIDAKREELSQAGPKGNPENISQPIDLSIDTPAEVVAPVTKKKGSDIDLSMELGKKEAPAEATTETAPKSEVKLVDKDYELSKDNQIDAEYDIQQGLGFRIGNNNYERKGDAIIRVKNHTPDWSNFNSDLENDPSIKRVINVTVGDYENSDSRRNKTSLETIQKEYPNVEFLDVKVEDGESVNEAIKRVSNIVNTEKVESTPTNSNEPSSKVEGSVGVVGDVELENGNKIQWNVYGNEESGEWTVGEKTKTRGGRDAVVLSKVYVEASSDGKSYTKEYADANGIKYDNERTVKHIVPLEDLQSLKETTKAGSVGVGGAKIKLDPDLANIDPIIIAARNGDKKAQEKLEEYGLDWEQTTTYRFVGQSEVDVLLANNKVESKRGTADAGIDVTTSSKVTSAANNEYRVTFKESFDLNNGLGKVKLKSKEEGDHHLEKGRGYDINDVAKIERIDENGNVIEVVYEQSLKETPKADSVGVGGDVESYNKENNIDESAPIQYHGTTKSRADKIKKEGFYKQHNVNITDDIDEAREYAKLIAEDEGGEPSIIKVRLKNGAKPRAKEGLESMAYKSKDVVLDYSEQSLKETPTQEVKANEPIVEDQKVSDSEIKALEEKRDSEVKELSKQKVVINMPSLIEIVNTKKPIENKEVYDDIKERLSMLDKFINCL